MRIDECLKHAATRLPATSESASLDAQLLLAEATGLTRTHFRTHPDHEIPAQQATAFERMIERRSRGEPVAYILGRQEFWSLTLQVTPDVLIPRPETELVVARALEHLPADAHPAVLDVGTGSGAIALALASERPQARVIATDISEGALACARANAARLNLGIELRQGDLYTAVQGLRFDVIVSNPPYISPADPDVSPAVRQYEPHVALFAQDDGLSTLRKLITEAPALLQRPGWIVLEHGWKQGEALRTLLVDQGFSHVRSHADLAGHERVTEAQWLR
jgi:release factor glutamine methyltransferase